MQKLAREYLDELNKRHKKNRRALVAWILMAVLVVGGVMGTLAQYGVAFEGSPVCEKDEHTHEDGCYTETQELTCTSEEEGHTHDDACYTVSKELTCELEEHTHGAGCYAEEPKPDDTPQPDKTAPAESNGNTENPENPPAVTDKDTEQEDPQNPPAGTDDVTTPEDPQNPPADTEDVTTPEDPQNPTDGTENGTEEGTVPDDSAETGTVSGNEVEAGFPPFDKTYSDKQVVIHVTADEGVIPEGAELKVVPVVKQDIKELEGQRNVAAEEIETAKEINDKYDAAAEKLEELAAEDETKNIAGFLAYDISFIVTDENGESIEIEPNSENGNVSVKMEFAKALLPEELEDKGDAPISSVDVIHMKEDGEELKAEVLENAEVSTTEKAEVEKAEFVVDSFSVFAIIWNGLYIQLSQTDADGANVGEASSPPIWLSNGINEIDFTNLDKIGDASFGEIETEDKTYTFVKAVLSEDFFINNTYNGVQSITKVYLENGTIKYLKENEVTGVPVNGPALNLHLLYSDGVTDDLKVVDTIDSTAKGVKMFMTNYPYNKELADAIEDDQGIVFGDIWKENEATQGLVECVLRDGFPCVSKEIMEIDTKKGNPKKSLKDYFDTSGTKAVNKLFLADRYDEDGTFYYSSFENYAQLISGIDADGNDIINDEFTVYEQIGGPEDDLKNYPLKISFRQGNFFPYNRIRQELAKFPADNPTDLYYDPRNTHVCDENGDPLSLDAKLHTIERKNEKGLDFHFSMRLETDFIQGKGGKNNGVPMVYEFNGDDDLWVFIDDVLVLDIGGIHGPISGSINFETGDVIVKNKTGDVVTTTLKDCFVKAKEYAEDKENEININIPDDIWVEYAKGKYRFKDYSGHTLKMFYMERNGNDETGASTLKISFNLPTIEEDEIRITKELTGTAQAQYASTDFEFLVQVKDGNGNWVALDKKEAYSNEAYAQGKAADINVVDGKFKLKAGQSAWFKELTKGQEYRVIEIGSVGTNSGGDTDYFIDTTNETFSDFDDRTQSGKEIKGVQTGIKTVGEDKSVVFRNECTERGKGELQITKKVDGNSTDKGSFKIKVWMKKNEAGVLTWEPYKGEYSITGGSNVEQEQQGEGKEPQKPLKTTNGEISLCADQTVSIKELVAGTIFYVEEINLDSTKYANPDIKPESGTTEDIKDDKPEGVAETGYAGEMIRNDVRGTITAKVTVTNKPITPDVHGLQITKYLESSDSAEETEPFTFKVWSKADEKAEYSLYEGSYSIDGDETSKTATNGIIEISANQTVRIDNLSAKAIFKVEEVLPENSLYGKPEATVAGAAQSIADTTSENGEYIYTVATGTIPETGYGDVVITNKLKPTYSYDWKIVKKGSSDSAPLLEDARFTLSPSANNQPKVTYYGKSDSKGVIQWFEDEEAAKNGTNPISPAAMVTGTYTLEETKAPTNYMVSGVKWTIELGYEQIAIKDNEGKDVIKDSASITEVNEGEKPQYVWVFLNEAAYELPSTGGSGIYRYMISGVLLMMAGVLILYNNKRARRCAGV